MYQEALEYILYIYVTICNFAIIVYKITSMKSIDFSSLLNTIGQNLHTIRNARKETLQGVASEIGVTHPVISKIENGRYPTLQLGL